MAKRVLVVDDDADILALVQAVLSEEGYEVATARNGREALAAVRSQKPQLILLDLAMPVMNGWEFVYNVRESNLAPSTPIVIMSASPQTDEQAKRLAVSGHLAKPFELDELLICAEKFLGDGKPLAVSV